VASMVAILPAAEYSISVSFSLTAFATSSSLRPDLSDKVRESVSVSVLDGSDIVFVSRVARQHHDALARSESLPRTARDGGAVGAMPREQRRQLGVDHGRATKFTLHRESDI